MAFPVKLVAYGGAHWRYVDENGNEYVCLYG